MHDGSGDIISSWLQWAVGAAWAAGIAVATFLWRLQTRVAILEQAHASNKSDIERRHRENLEALYRMQNSITSLGSRIDTIVDRRRGS